MNRLFGTRFNVAATRCTDGIWMSLVELFEENTYKVFVLLDCEGLFSARRNEQEEMKLCLALSSISDVMILNQDLSFNRYLNSLFNNFTKSIDRIKGKKLFKGCLMIFVRDVKSEESEMAYKELQANFIQIQTSKQDSFLTKVFQGKLQSQCLNYFQQPIFEDEIKMIREVYFLSLNQERWSNGRDLLESIKITLSQIFADDDTDMDIHKLKISCEHYFQKAIDMYFNGGALFDQVNSIIKTAYKINDLQYEVQIHQQNIKLSSDSNNDLNFQTDKPLIPVELYQPFQEQSCFYQQSIHNEFLYSFKKFIQEVIEKRKEIVLEIFVQSLPSDTEFQDIINSYVYKLKDIIDTYSNKLFYCQKICRVCKRGCVLRQSHQNNCDCGTNHICSEQCDKTIDCEYNKFQCIKIYGHEEDHRCKEGNHKCNEQCQIFECLQKCSNEFQHPLEQTHNCGNRHPCNQKCEDNLCFRTCQFDVTINHVEHHCGETKCIYKCQFCDRQCIFNYHFHQKLIENREEEKLFLNFEQEYFMLNFHICDNEHLCKNKCEQKGVCSIDYKIEEKIWKNEFGEFPYPYFSPEENRNDCKLMIPKLMKKHKEYHNCKIGEHRCFNQCPECKSFCNKIIDHEGLHGTKTHRNKESSVFVSRNDKKEKISFIQEGKKREYKVGESCQPENCTISCSRRGRAHYHIKECKTDDLCQAKINPFVKHSTNKYYPFEDKKFDQWLCLNYWNSYEWEPPIEQAKLEEISTCNYICCHSSHKDLNQFCINPAWHTDNHNFNCDHPGFCNTNIIDVMFCCDATGSMGRYIKKSKRTIKRIIEKIKNLAAKEEDKEERSLLFGFVAYRDHPPQDETFVTKSQPLTNAETILDFINELNAEGGGDGAEAVLDGLMESILKANWRKDSLRFLFHIADAPPHGRKFNRESDGFPDGCPCKLTESLIAQELKNHKIKYKLLKIGSYVNTMASIFKKEFEDYEECELESAEQLEIAVESIVIKDIEIEEHDFLIE